MQGRLTFATATSLNPEVLIVDEALATGDALFQEKCYHRMREICNSGATVLIVTHSLSIIYEICNTCILLRAGKILDFGEPRKVGETYERLLAEEREPGSYLTGAKAKLPENSDLPTASGLEKPDPSGSDETRNNPEVHPEELSQVGLATETAARSTVDVSDPENVILARIESVDVLNLSGVSVRNLVFGRAYTVRILVALYDDLPIINVGFKLQRDTGVAVIGDTTYENGKRIGGSRGDQFYVDFEWVCRLATGNYILGAGVTKILDATRFSLLDMRRGVMVLSVEGKRLNGLVDPQSNITITRVDRRSY
jgi:ABC-type glutathione transport system ATPase component